MFALRPFNYTDDNQDALLGETHGASRPYVVSSDYGEQDRALIIELTELVYRDWWRAIADYAGVSKRVWRRDNPFARGEHALTLSGREIVFDQSTWIRLLGLFPGAVALPSRLAQLYGVHPSGIRQVASKRNHLNRSRLKRSRLIDLFRYRSYKRRHRRYTARASAELARLKHRISAELTPRFLGDSEPEVMGLPFNELPPYALATRLEQLLGTNVDWSVFVCIELLAHAPSDSSETAELWREREEVIRQWFRLIESLLHALADRLAAREQISDLDSIYDLTFRELMLLARQDVLGAQI